MKEYKLIVSAKFIFKFKVDLENEETKDILKSFNETISSDSDIEDVLKHYAFNYIKCSFSFCYLAYIRSMFIVICCRCYTFLLLSG